MRETRIQRDKLFKFIKIRVIKWILIEPYGPEKLVNEAKKLNSGKNILKL